MDISVSFKSEDQAVKTLEDLITQVRERGEGRVDIEPNAQEGDYLHLTLINENNEEFEVPVYEAR